MQKEFSLAVAVVNYSERLFRGPCECEQHLWGET